MNATRLRTIASFALAGVALLATAVAQGTAATTARQSPNIIFLQAEGQGWTSTSVPTGKDADAPHGVSGLTPNLERLAAGGMVFGNFLAASPRCTPSRAAFLTGISPARLHMTFVNEGGNQRRGKRGNEEPDAPAADTKLVPPSPVMELPQGVRTIADLLRQRGYATAHFGKWHVGRASPAQHGFDAHDGANSNIGPDGDRTPNPEQGRAITAAGIAFMQAQVKAGRPFYLQLDHYGGGTAEESRPETRQALASQLRQFRGKQAFEAAVLADVDANLGTLLQQLDALGIADRTYVIFSSDHGAPGRNLPLRGGKGSVLEGGVRVPFFVRGPLVKPGSFSAVRATGCDLLPTVAELAGVQALPDQVEGGSLLALLRGDKNAEVHRTRPELVIHFPHYDHDNGGPMSSLYLDDYKLIRSYETGTDQLFDIRNDPQESRDLASAQKERTSKLGKLLTAYLTAVDAQLPTLRR